jgi:DNA-binding NtrC family response regulator
MDMRKKIPGDYEFDEIVGASPELKSVMQQATNAAKSDAAVLITGERGTGKELIARAIHRMGNKTSHSFMKFDCARITPAAFEARFGRDTRRRAANPGTLLLTHVESISQDLRPRLLEVFERRQSGRSGTSAAPIDANLIATMTDTGQKAEDVEFYQRLSNTPNLSVIRVPALRERRGDIPLLASYFMKRWARRMNRAIDAISNDTVKALEKYDWPDNVRELENVIGRLVGSAVGRELHSENPIEG